MTEHVRYQVPAGWLEKAVGALAAAEVEVLVPVEDGDGVALGPAPAAAALPEYVNLLVPLKRLAFPETEVLLAFERGEGADVDLRPAGSPAGEMTVIGCRPCDAAALDVLDTVFQWDYDDVRYRRRRERMTVVTVACTAPDARCFCTSVGGSPHGTAGSDAVVYPREDGSALVDVVTAKGSRFIERLGQLARPAPPEAAPPLSPAVETRFDPGAVRAWLDENFESPFWREAALRCVGCGACSYLCPTCHCFDIVDEGTWNRGERRRNWDCCSFALFTLHGSGHNPRPDQAARYRQRVMHKFKYIPDRFERIGCVGCGRCLRVCGVGQNLLEVLRTIQAQPLPEPTAAGGNA